MPYDQKCPFTAKVQELHSGQRRIIKSLDKLMRMMEEDDEGFTSVRREMKEPLREPSMSMDDDSGCATLAKKLRSLQQGQMMIIKYVNMLLRIQEVDDEGYLKRTRTFSERELQNLRPPLDRRRTVF